MKEGDKKERKQNWLFAPWPRKISNPSIFLQEGYVAPITCNKGAKKREKRKREIRERGKGRVG